MFNLVAKELLNRGEVSIPNILGPIKIKETTL